jgi:hypothetical protein
VEDKLEQAKLTLSEFTVQFTLSAAAPEIISSHLVGTAILGQLVSFVPPNPEKY